MGLTAGIGVAYSKPITSTVKAGANEYTTRSNMLDIFAYAGYRVLQVDYKVSAFLNAGCTMGDVNDMQPFFSTKILFPVGQKAFSVEPFYVVNRGFSGQGHYLLPALILTFIVFIETVYHVIGVFHTCVSIIRW